MGDALSLKTAIRIFILAKIRSRKDKMCSTVHTGDWVYNPESPTEAQIYHFSGWMESSTLVSGKTELNSVCSWNRKCQNTMFDLPQMISPPFFLFAFHHLEVKALRWIRPYLASSFWSPENGTVWWILWILPSSSHRGFSMDSGRAAAGPRPGTGDRQKRRCPSITAGHNTAASPSAAATQLCLTLGQPWAKGHLLLPASTSLRWVGKGTSARFLLR